MTGRERGASAAVRLRETSHGGARSEREAPAPLPVHARLHGLGAASELHGPGVAFHGPGAASPLLPPPSRGRRGGVG